MMRTQAVSWLNQESRLMNFKETEKGLYFFDCSEAVLLVNKVESKN